MHHDTTNEEDTDSNVPLDPKMTILREKLRSNIHSSEALLSMMTTPTREVCSAPVAAQLTLHVGYIERMKELAYGVATDLIYSELEHRSFINDAELNDLITSMIDIGHKASATYKGLCNWEASITRANLKLQTATKCVQKEKDIRQL